MLPALAAKGFQPVHQVIADIEAWLNALDMSVLRLMYDGKYVARTSTPFEFEGMPRRQTSRMWR